MSKNLLITGVAGDNTTGDTLYNGATKLNAMLSEIYDAFGLQGSNPQDIHATGYYQTPARAYYTYPVEAGSMLNVDTRNGVLTVKLPNGKIGEMVKLRDPFGSWATNPISVKADGIEEIDSLLTPVVLNINFIEVTFVCINDTPGQVNWTYTLKSLMDRDVRLVDSVFVLTPSNPVTYTIGSTASFTSAQLFITGLQRTGGTAVTSSEIHLAHDGTTHVYNESSVLSTGTTRVYDIDFSIQSGSVIMTITTTLPQVKVAVRSTDFTRIVL
jgi:hypothetical protein